MSIDKKQTICQRTYQLNIPQMLSGGMSENWLLKELGDVHWHMISKAFDSRTDELVDSNGERLYASFVRVSWEMKSECIGAFHENEDVSLKGDLSLYGNKMLFSKDTLSSSDKKITSNLMTVFSSRKGGDNEKLIKGKPLNVQEAKVKKYKSLPSFAKEFFKLKSVLFPEGGKHIEKAESSFSVWDQDFPLVEEPCFMRAYEVDPYDDINGVGLLYFASYSKISDKCERHYFQEQYEHADGTPFNWADTSSCIARDIHYYGNANARDVLDYALEYYTINEDDQTVSLVSALYRQKDARCISKIFTVKKIHKKITRKQTVKKKITLPKATEKPVFSPTKKQLIEGVSKEALEKTFCDFFAKMFPEQSVSTASDLRQLGLESIGYIELSEYLNLNLKLSTNPSDFFGLNSINEIIADLMNDTKSLAPVSLHEENQKQTIRNKEDIAIVGMSFALPGGIETKEDFWRILEKGDHAIETLPEDRWIWPSNIDPKGTHVGIDKGGFIKEIQSFDADFFNISPLEAEIMDPQQRKLLEACWHCLEDSGILEDEFKGTNTGVFVGASGSDYSRYIGQETMAALVGVGTAVSVLANRVSHIFDLKGPSIQLDTACSSSLVALHQAVQAIRNGECEQALVGGVNCILHPLNTEVYYNAGMLNKAGFCKTFDEEANGYVRGEGVLVFMIKPLSKALEDGQTPYGVIKGTAVNHGGNVGGFTVPNPNQQAAMIKKAVKDADLRASDISYIEAHGTGTKLGDPIEVNGLKKAFESIESDDKHSCHIGSVKTNIGHLEAAAGLAGLAKVLLAFQNETIPPIAHFKKMNPHISLADTPFKLNKNAVKWDVAPDQNRVAGISSFGSGGTNAHVIVAQVTETKQEQKGNCDHCLIVVSGNTEEALLRNQAKLGAWVEHQSTLDLQAISYHLLTGRTHLKFRMAFIVSDRQELLSRLSANTDDSVSDHILYSKDYMNIKPQSLYTDWILDYLEQNGDNPLNKEMMLGLAEVFVRGGNFPWGSIFKEYHPKRISLPKYSFKKTSYWVTTKDERGKNPIQLHPLIHENKSIWNKQRFITRFKGTEQFFKEHQLQNKSLLPGVAFLEMVRYALEKSIPDAKGFIRMQRLIWKSPILGKDNVVTELDTKNVNSIPFSITNQASRKDCCIGHVSLSEFFPNPYRALTYLKTGGWETVSREEFYENFREKEYVYGSHFQTVTNFHRRDQEAYSTLRVNDQENPTDSWNLGVLDGALQTALYAFALPKEETQIVFPFSVENIWSSQRIPQEIETYFVHTYKVKENIHVDILDAEGMLHFRFENLVFVGRMNQKPVSDTHCYAPIKKILPAKASSDIESKKWVIAYGSTPFLNKLNPVVELPWVDKLQTIKNTTKSGDFKKLIVQLLEQLSREHTALENLITLWIVIEKSDTPSLAGGIMGALNSIQQEWPMLSFQVIEMSQDTLNTTEALSEINNKYSHQARIIWDQGKANSVSWKHSNVSTRSPWKDHGTYLITGGAGGIGKHLVEEIAKQVKKPTLLLIGTSDYDTDRKQLVEKLQGLGARAVYQSVDITNKNELIHFKNNIVSKYGNIHGIIHAAGVNMDVLWRRFDEAKVDVVLDPKVLGTDYLDAVWSDEKLEFFWLFSSIIPVLGNIGQTLYGAANGYMDDFAEHRNIQVQNGKRFGKTLSINWPYWTNGGMQMPEKIQESIYQKYGIKSLTTEQALQSFHHFSDIIGSQVLVASGSPDRILTALQETNSVKKPYGLEKTNEPRIKVATRIEKTDDLKPKVSEYFKKLFADFLKKDVKSIDEKSHMEHYGINSIMILELTLLFENLYGKISKTLFFEYKTIDELVDYFMEKHPDTTYKLIGATLSVDNDSPIITANEEVVSQKSTSLSRQEMEEGIAIIGVSGRYPKAGNLDEFWDNLVQGVDCITEIPKDRWDYRKYFDPEKGRKGKTYSKWGGFIDDVACFDPLFFNITPLEAEYMDPQERLFLQCAYATLEDAGYTRKRLLADGAYEVGPNIGVFAGVMYEEYQLYGAQLTQMGFPRALGGIPASIANRVSHYFDFHGPSMGVDTMCSSGLTAIDIACKSIYMGDCDTALAGAVNTSLHPNKYLMLAQGNFISTKGRCESFGVGGEGYVPGEGVGIVMLKRLSKAIEDNDQIYGVIKSSAVNHGGKTNGYTVPNPHAQAAVIKRAMKKAEINPDHIGYVEAHGTGTALGDPIEIAGLNRAFAERTKSCPIGSVKSNIGHCESVAGISGLTKVLLQLKHQQLVPSLHSEKLNPNIDFEDTVFHVQQQVEPWSNLVLDRDGIEEVIPRMAAISSFGAGGANAHLIIEEYQTPVAPVVDKGPYPIVLSAKTNEQLHQKLNDLRLFIEKRKTVLNLADIAYTLQIGRESMKYKVAMISYSISELLEQLEAVWEQGIRDDIYFDEITAKEQYRGYQEINLNESLAHKAMADWLLGQTADWESLPSREYARIISLPSYPFAKEVYWPDLSPLNQGIPDKGIHNEQIEEFQWLKKRWLNAPLESNEKQGVIPPFLIITAEDTQDIAQKLLHKAGHGTIVLSEDFGKYASDRQETFEILIDITPLSNSSTVYQHTFAGLQQLIEVRQRPCVILGIFDATSVEWGGYSTLYKFLGYEYRKIQSKSLTWETPIQEDHLFAKRIIEELQSPVLNSEIRIIKDGTRQLPVLQKTLPKSISQPRKLAREKVVWITGGTRGIGLTCAKHLVEQHGVKKLVLSGKTVWPSRETWDTISDSVWKRRIQDIKELEDLGATVHVSSVDLTKKIELKQEIDYVQKDMGPVGMLLHAAGIADFDTPAFVKKEIHTVEQVLQPKKQGTRLLLETLSSQYLEQVILFSSVSSIIPSLAVGQLDYAVANTYLDLTAYSQHNYPFDIVSIQWPNWKESGMGEVKSKAYTDSGLTSISNKQGLLILDQILNLQGSQVLMPASVIQERWKPETLLELPNQLTQSTQHPRNSITTQTSQIENPAKKWLIDLFSDELHIPKDRLETDREFGDFGVDSIILTQLMRSINTVLNAEIDPSIFYEYATINTLSRWIYEHHGAYFGKSKDIKLYDNQVDKENHVNPFTNKVGSSETKPSVNQEYAIVGVSARFPESPNMEALWELISQGKKAIKEVPNERWGQSHVGYAGLLDSIDRFDTDYFMVAPEDAVSMDPQALLTLEETLNLIYQSGYTKEEMKRTPTGVYLGARSRHIPDQEHLKGAKNPILAMGQNYLSANVSQYFDFQGPSLVVDTACSSALTALDIACKDLLNGDIDQAIVGGVNLLQTDEAQEIFKQRGILNLTGAFDVFDANANGVVLGEGIGMVLVKKLEDALEDGDKIEAVLSGLAINNDGRTAGHATPNIEAQKEVMRKALRKSNLNPDQIAHIEVNGSGTELTDLIELKAIKAIYSGDDDNLRSLGSIKPNIGHPLCAEGMASLLKLISMLKYKKKVPFISGHAPMKHFDLNKEGYVLDRKASNWDGTLLAGAINCFADGGTNAHAIMRSVTVREKDKQKRNTLHPPQLKPRLIGREKIDEEETLRSYRNVEPATTRNFWNEKLISN